jgi:hypothetical protein
MGGFDLKKVPGPIHLQISLTSPNDQDNEGEETTLRTTGMKIGEKLQELKIISEA